MCAEDACAYRGYVVSHVLSGTSQSFVLASSHRQCTENSPIAAAGSSGLLSSEETSCS